MHRALNIAEVLNLIFLHLQFARHLLHAAMVCRQFSTVALRILWRKHQFTLHPLLLCVPRSRTLRVPIRAVSSTALN